MTAYYNEFDPKAAAWLRQLIKNGMIADGEVDDRSITEVEPIDLKGFSQHHFFAGIGGWSYALRIAGWADDRPVCTASLPCQPFSVAGQQRGKSDERHLLPHFIELVKQCNFKTIFGEQVPGAIKHGWLDDLCVEMERENYAVGAIVLTAAGAGAPHIRQRLYWVSDSNKIRCNSGGKDTKQKTGELSGVNIRCANNRMADNINQGQQRGLSGWQDSEREIIDRYAGCDSTDINGMGNTEHHQRERGIFGHREESSQNSELSTSEFAGSMQTWTNPDWIYCRDNKYRPIKPGIKPLVDRLSRGVGYSSYTSESIDANNTQEARVMRLKGYGNAIVPQVAAQFISAFMELNL